MTAKFYHRETCRLCDSKNVELVVKLEPIPLSENYCIDSQTGRNAERYPVDLYMCKACGHVQQLDIVDAKCLWENYTYCSGNAKGMPEHFHDVSQSILSKYNLPENSLVTDIGSNDGSLLKPFKQAGCNVLGIDPAIEIANQATRNGIETIPELMSLDLAKNLRKKRGTSQVVLCFNAFAHADNLREMIEAIKILMAPEGVFIFEAQYLIDIIDRVLIATIFHEHMSHHSVKPLSNFFASHGLELIDVQRVPIQHGSILGTVQLKGGPYFLNQSVEDLLCLEQKRELDKTETLKQFSCKINELRQKTRGLMAHWKQNGCAVAGYGAARSGPTLISQLGLRDIIEYIVDDHPQKVNKYSSGDGIKIIPTEKLCKRMPEYTIILAWVHADKIIQNNQEYLKKGGRFVVLCPEIRVVGKNGDIELTQ